MNPFYQRLQARLEALGGMFNAHLHLDRAGTLDEKYMQQHGHVILENSHISLHEKHSLINVLHNGVAYEKDDLASRINACLDVMVASNTFRADSLVDVSADRVGLSALQTMSEIKRARAHEIDLRIGAYSPFGFRDDAPERWDIFCEGAAEADFIAALPEADDTDDYPQHIGFFEHCRRMLELGQEKQCMVHVHTDQRNEPSENGTERLLAAIREYGAPQSADGEPMVWAVHMISPSTYEESRFQRLLADLVELNVGVICCPSAAIGMRQLRPLATPTYNSIPRVLELLAGGVHVRLASDNIADICSPSTTADLVDEIFVLSAAVRYYDIGILAQVAAGKALDENQRQQLREHLAANDQEIAQVLDEVAKATL
jgi:cytosine deaminase